MKFDICDFITEGNLEEYSLESSIFFLSSSSLMLIKLDNSNLLFTTGDFRNRTLAQNIDSNFGKILKINTQTKKADVVSLGHRNPQGLYYSKEFDFILDGPSLSNIVDAADDTAAATAGIAVGGVYRTGSVLKIRVS